MPTTLVIYAFRCEPQAAFLAKERATSCIPRKGAHFGTYTTLSSTQSHMRPCFERARKLATPQGHACRHMLDSAAVLERVLSRACTRLKRCALIVSIPSPLLSCTILHQASNLRCEHTLAADIDVGL
jgi:hypothetical protein